ncbi:MAG: hypothetical protein Aurels2KO_24360 [Aureliella sp.]
MLPAHMALADVIQTGDILDSYAFSNGTIGTGSSLSLNLWNDSTGARLTMDNGDQADLTINYTRTIVGVTAGSASGSLEYQLSNQRLRASHNYGSASRTVNNPGTRITHTIDFTFGDHVNVTGLDVDFSSLNTAGTTWEFSKLGYIVAGNPANNSEPTVSAYDSHTTVNGQAPGVGWFLVDSKATATQVGQDTVVAGVNGPLEQLTNSNGNGLLDYDDVGLAAGTQISGFRWVTVLEDVRGVSNPAGGLTASMIQFSPSGTISAVPEPSAAFALSCAVLTSLLPFRRTKR